MVELKLNGQDVETFDPDNKYGIRELQDALTNFDESEKARMRNLKATLAALDVLAKSPKLIATSRGLYGECVICEKTVRVDKPIFGALHLCLTACQEAGRHLDEKTRRRGPFWKRRTENYCGRCGAVEH